MNMEYQTPYGMHDVLPEEQPYWSKVRQDFARLSRAYGFSRIDTPILEYMAVFQKGVGQGTDIVDKEMYYFEDKGGDWLALRPEFTAGVIRAYLECGMRSRPQPVKLASVGPLFRRDRPGAGRFRQFYQINAETIGTDDPAADAELIALCSRFGADLGIGSMTILLNSTGCPACKPPYIEALVGFLRERTEKLGKLDQERVERNPLRVLDSKDRETRKALAGVPILPDFLCEGCREHYGELRKLLTEVGIPFTEQPTLVRGLDYYTRTVFECVCESAPLVGTILGGGRYDGLAEILGGPPTPAVGFAGGIERMILAMQEEEESPRAPAGADVFVAYIGDDTKETAFGLAEGLRQAGAATVVGLGKRGLKSQMKLANRSGAALTIIVGAGELAEGKVQIRDMTESDQQLIPLEEVTRTVCRRLEIELS